MALEPDSLAAARRSVTWCKSRSGHGHVNVEGSTGHSSEDSMVEDLHMS